MLEVTLAKCVFGPLFFLLHVGSAKNYLRDLSAASHSQNTRGRHWSRFSCKNTFAFGLKTILKLRIKQAGDRPMHTCSTSANQSNPNCHRKLVTSFSFLFANSCAESLLFGENLAEENMRKLISEFLKTNFAMCRIWQRKLKQPVC